MNWPRLTENVLWVPLLKAVVQVGLWGGFPKERHKHSSDLPSLLWEGQMASRVLPDLAVWLCCKPWVSNRRKKPLEVATKVSAVSLSAEADVHVGRGYCFIWEQARERVISS